MIQISTHSIPVSIVILVIFVFFGIAQGIGCVEPANFTGFEILPQNTSVDGLNTDEISGITFDSFDGSYYAISDNLIPNKGFYEFTFEKTTQSTYALISGTQMDSSAELPLYYMDTEGIAFIKNPTDPSDSYFIVSQEGHKTYNTENELYLYSTDGSYIRTISDQLNPLFSVQNTEDNRGIEPISVDKNQQFFVYTSETPLLTDSSFCSNCVRISVNNFDLDTESDNINVELTELYQLRYDLDAIDTTQYPDPDAFNGISDIVIFTNENNENNELYALILERAFLESQTIPVLGDVAVFDNKIYLVDLTQNEDNKDVKNCISYSECSDIDPIDKTLLFQFAGNVGTDSILAQTINFLNFDTVSILYDGNSLYDENGIVNLVAITDNGGFSGVHTALVYLQFDVSCIVDDDSDDDDSDDDDSGSDDSSSDDGAAAMAIGSRLNGDNNEENNGTTEQIVISFSKNAMMNIWALVIGFLVVNVVIAWCYCFKSKKTRVTFEDQGGSRV